MSRLQAWGHTKILGAVVLLSAIFLFTFASGCVGSSNTFTLQGVNVHGAEKLNENQTGALRVIYDNVDHAAGSCLAGNLTEMNVSVTESRFGYYQVDMYMVCKNPALWDPLIGYGTHTRYNVSGLVQNNEVVSCTIASEG